MPRGILVKFLRNAAMFGKHRKHWFFHWQSCPIFYYYLLNFWIILKNIVVLIFHSKTN